MLVPAETLLYLETNDLAAALQPIINSKPFTEVAKSTPDLSLLKGVRVAVAVTGFETSEEKLTDEHSIGKVQPRFVAVIDTNAWDWQAVKFAETGISGFVQELLGGDAKMGRSQKSQETGGTYITWASSNGRLAHALVIDGLIFFGNDATTIDKCLAVRRGESDSIATTGKLKPLDPETLASGYVSTEGIAQIANIAALQFASETGEDAEVQGAMAGILPQIVRGLFTDVSWSMKSGKQGIEDIFVVSMPSETAAVFSESMSPTDKPDPTLSLALNSEIRTTTNYNFRDPKIAFDALREQIGRSLTPLADQIVQVIFPSLFEEYGIRDIDLFLRSAGSMIQTRSTIDGEKQVVFASVKDADGMSRSILGPLKSEEIEAGDAKMEVLVSEDKEFAAQFHDGSIFFGDYGLVTRDNRDLINDDRMKTFVQTVPAASALTISANFSAASICSVFANCREGRSPMSISTTETRFNRTGMERKTTSDFGFIGWMIVQLSAE